LIAAQTRGFTEDPVLLLRRVVLVGNGSESESDGVRE
jgi:hypothetical protein